MLTLKYFVQGSVVKTNENATCFLGNGQLAYTLYWLRNQNDYQVISKVLELKFECSFPSFKKGARTMYIWDFSILDVQMDLLFWKNAQCVLVERKLGVFERDYQTNHAIGEINTKLCQININQLISQIHSWDDEIEKP